MTELTVDTLRELAAGAIGAAKSLRSLSIEQRAEAIAQAAARLCDGQCELGCKLRDELGKSERLSQPMIEWGLKTALGAASRKALLKATTPLQTGEDQRPVPAQLAAVILAGNVFTASIRAVALPLLAGVPVLAKASSADSVMPLYTKLALDQVEPLLGAAYQATVFPGSEQKLIAALCEEAEVVVVYGDDITSASVRSALRPGARLAAHGHGLGALYMPITSFCDSASTLKAISRVALDVAAYDQRGCLSPQVIFVQKGGHLNGLAIARLLAEAGLSPLQNTLPRGALLPEEAAAQMQWRAVAAARGKLFEGNDFAVSFEGDEKPRPSPGYRNIGVYECDDSGALNAKLQVFGAHLKALGVTGDRKARLLAADALRPPLAPRLCAAGEMQTPGFDVLWDGQDSWNDLVRWIEVS